MDIARVFSSVWKFLTKKRTIPGISHPLVLKWLESYEYHALIEAWQRVGKLPFPIPTTLKFKDQTFKVILPLGAGAEGAVYLVKTPEGFRVAKVFFGPSAKEAVKSHARQLKSFKLSGFNAPDVLDTDDQRSINLNEFVEGVPVDAVLNPRVGLLGDKLPAILKVREEFYAQMRREFPSVYGDLRTGFMDSNLIYSFRDQRIYIIDPH